MSTSIGRGRPWVARRSYRQLRAAGAARPQAAYILAVAGLIRALPVLLVVAAVGLVLSVLHTGPVGHVLLIGPVVAVGAWMVVVTPLAWSSAACSLSRAGRQFSGGWASVRFWRYVRAVALRHDLTAVTATPPRPATRPHSDDPVEPMTARQWEQQLAEIEATQKRLDKAGPRSGG